MIIKGKDGASIAVYNDDGAGDTIRIWVRDEEGIAAVLIDQNHAEALETAIRAARLELQARAVSL